MISSLRSPTGDYTYYDPNWRFNERKGPYFGREFTVGGGTQVSLTDPVTGEHLQWTPEHPMWGKTATWETARAQALTNIQERLLAESAARLKAGYLQDIGVTGESQVGNVGVYGSQMGGWRTPVGGGVGTYSTPGTGWGGWTSSGAPSYGWAAMSWGGGGKTGGHW